MMKKQIIIVLSILAMSANAMAMHKNSKSSIWTVSKYLNFCHPLGVVSENGGEDGFLERRAGFFLAPLLSCLYGTFGENVYEVRGDVLEPYYYGSKKLEACGFGCGVDCNAEFKKLCNDIVQVEKNIQYFKKLDCYDPIKSGKNASKCSKVRNEIVQLLAQSSYESQAYAKKESEKAALLYMTNYSNYLKNQAQE